MKQELADKIFEKCPELFSSLKHIEAPDGWFKLIETASVLIENTLKSLPPELQGQVKAVQIKSKFGGARYYLSKSTPYINGVISLVESLSFSTCEKCSLSAKNRGWNTLCDTCFEIKSK